MTLDERHLISDTDDVVTQECASHHSRRDTDGTIRYAVGHFRYLWPAASA